MKFKLEKQSQKSKARLAELITAHGKIHTPFFMPIATRAAIKTLTMAEMRTLGAEIILSNTYHLYLKPGQKLIKKFGGLHRFMNWPGPILTDSGGYQVFSLSKMRKLTERGAESQVEEDGGKKHLLTPEKVIDIQSDLGVDIMMVLDECPPYPCKKEYAAKSLELTTRWAERCQDEFKKTTKQPSRVAGRKSNKIKPGLFGIVQGSTFKDLRIRSARQLVGLGFDGYAIGGVAVGEPREKMREILGWVEPELPADKPRYLMGLGRPEEIILAVKNGMDMFDCVIPTREGRHGRLFVWRRADLAGKFYEAINIEKPKFKTDNSPINKKSKIPELREYSKAYLYHLYKTKEALGMRLASLNNLEFYLELMQKIRQGISRDKI